MKLTELHSAVKQTASDVTDDIMDEVVCNYCGVKWRVGNLKHVFILFVEMPCSCRSPDEVCEREEEQAGVCGRSHVHLTLLPSSFKTFFFYQTVIKLQTKPQPAETL